MSDLNRTIVSISRGLNNAPGPNTWENCTKADFGPEHDFELYDHGSIWIFWPVSNAALQWCYAHLPEDAPRWGAKGYAVEHRYIGNIVLGAKRDGLMSEIDYNLAQEEAANLAVQWEES